MDPILLRLVVGFGINLMFGIVAFMREMVDDTGFIAGVTIFTLVYVFLDWQAYVIIALFFVITGVCIEIENTDKANKGGFELYKAKRTISRVMGRSLAGVLFAGLFFVTGRPEFKLAFAAAYAESVFDTVSTKLGKLFSASAVLITNFKKVHRGTPGAVSWQGTVSGILAALILSGSAFVIRLIKGPDVFIVLAGAFIGVMVDSFLNAYSYQKKRVPNEIINLSSSVFAGLACVWIKWLLGIFFGVNTGTY
ncbi:MAG: DUF92 domain-containing protein [Candidatus Omnitrophica bacterium]|nr:DUF92 domain-containing protein [Candidatus Omnitrophota bacterium]